MTFSLENPTPPQLWNQEKLQLEPACNMRGNETFSSMRTKVLRAPFMYHIDVSGAVLTIWLFK